MRITGRSILAAVTAVAALLVSQGVIAADEKQVHEVRPVLDSLPANLEGIIVELRQTVNPQIAVFNLTTEPLHILDENGSPFLVINPQDVQGNYARPAYHHSRYAGDGPLPNNAHGADRWYQISEAPTWGWFDTRLRIPANATTGEWRIPVRLGSRESAITGQFVNRPASGGVYRAVIDSQDLGMKDVSVHPLAGHEPGIFVHARGNDKFNIGGLAGEKFLRFLPSKVLVNRSGKTWQMAAPADALVPYTPPGDEPERWAIISTAGGFGWLDPRMAPAKSKQSGSAPKTVKEWKIPVETDSGTHFIKGHTEWLP